MEKEGVGMNCSWCNQEYTEMDSDAHDKETYCSRDCELKDGGVDDNRRRVGRGGGSVSKRR